MYSVIIIIDGNVKFAKILESEIKAMDVLREKCFDYSHGEYSNSLCDIRVGYRESLHEEDEYEIMSFKCPMFMVGKLLCV